MRIGLLGGSFNPPHEGHIHISKISLHSLKLDAVWWLVTPHNPLKAAETLLNYEDRLSLCRSMVQHPSVVVTDLERQTGTNRTFDTVSCLKNRFSGTQFVLLTGMDNALSFHLWHRWRDLLDLVPTAHVARPPAFTLINQCPLKMLASQRHIFVARPQPALLKAGTTYWLMQTPLVNISSTALRGDISDT